MEPSLEATDSPTSWISSLKLSTKKKIGLALSKCKKASLRAFYFVVLYLRKISFISRLRGESLLISAVDNTKLVRRLSLVVCAFLVAHILLQFTDPTTARISEFSDYLSTIGAMIGGVLAVVFSLTSFGQQSILDIHSTKILHRYVYGIKEKSIFFSVSLITILFFAAGRWTSDVVQPNPLAFITLTYATCLLIAVVFVLVDFLYQNVSGKASSAEVFGFLKKEAVSLIKRMDADSRRLAAVAIAEGKAKEKQTWPAMLISQSREAIYKKYKPSIDERIKVVYEITIRLIGRKEYEPANNGVRVMHDIISHYLLKIADSSTSKPAGGTSLGVLGILARVSDSADFLNTNLERLARIGEQTILNENVQNIQLITDVFKSLVSQAENIKHAGTTTENYVLPLIIGYHNQYLDFAIRQNNIEAVFQVAQSLSHLATASVRGGSSHAEAQVREAADKIILFAVKGDKGFVINECFNAMLSSIAASFHSEMPYEYTSIDDSLKQMGSNVEVIFLATRAGIHTDPFTSTFFFTQFLMFFPHTINQYSQIADERKKREYRKKLIKTAEYLKRVLRDLSEKIKDVDNPLVEVIGRTIDQMGEYLIFFLNHPDYTEHKAEIERTLYAYIHLPSWFVTNAAAFEKTNRNRSLVEGVTKIGILLFSRYRNERLIEACADSLFSLVKYLFKKNPKSYLFDEARVMIKVCYLGILARKYGMTRVYAHIQVKIMEFDQLYSHAYNEQLRQVPEDLREKAKAGRLIGFPDKNRLKVEMYEWRREFSTGENAHMARLMGDSRGLMHEVITLEDIDWFMWEVWEEIDAYSPISNAVDLKMARLRLVKTLKRIALARIKK